MNNCVLTGSCYLLHCLIPKAAGCVVIHHPYRLHEGITNRRADELESPFFQVFAHCIGFFCFRRYLRKKTELMTDWFTTDKLPDVFIEAAEFFLNLEHLLGIYDRCTNFQTVAN